MSENIVKTKSKAFALRAVHLVQELTAGKHEYILSNQFLRSATSIGANVVEAHHAMSRKEFVSKLNISLKEAAETEFWLDLLFEGGYIGKAVYSEMREEAVELQKLLTRIIKTTKERQ